MSFDIEHGVNEMLGAMKLSIGSDYMEIEAFARQALVNQESSVKILAQALENGDLDRDEFEYEMKREMQVVEIELLATKVMGKAAIQKALQAAVTALTRFIKPF